MYYYCSWSLTLSRSRDNRRYAFTFSVLSILFGFSYFSSKPIYWFVFGNGWKPFLGGKKNSHYSWNFFTTLWLNGIKEVRKTEETSQFRIHVRIVSSIPCMKEIKTKKKLKIITRSNKFTCYFFITRKVKIVFSMQWNNWSLR